MAVAHGGPAALAEPATPVLLGAVLVLRIRSVR